MMANVGLPANTDVFLMINYSKKQFILEPAAYCHSDCGVSHILAPSISEMIHTIGDGNPGYTNSEAKEENSAPSYNQEANPVHSVGINDAYAGLSKTAALVQA